MNSSSFSNRKVLLALGLTAVALAGYGCFERQLKPVNPCTRSRVGDTVQVTNVDKVDLLLMIDNSNSMTEEQISIVTEIPRIINILTSGDRDADGMRDFTPARSLHVGIVSSDMGTGTVSGIESCSAGFGDDGIMFNHGSTGTGCMASYPSAIFDFQDGRDDPATFSTAVGCVAALGTDGCGFEHQLESPLKALSLVPQADGSSPVTWTRPGYRPPVFLGATFGHGGAGGTNDGFMRPDSALAIIVITDEEDCSALDPSIFDRTDARYSSVDLNLRCHTFVDAQYPVQRYIDGFIGLRSQSSLLIFGAITGVPPDAVASGLGYDAILGLEEMTERIDPVLHNRLLPSCTAPAGRGVAYPPRRIVQVAQGLDRLGASTTVQSICNTSFTGAVDVIIEKISAALAGACLPRELNPDAEGNVPCDVFQLLPQIGGSAEFQHCADLFNPDAFELEREEVTTVGGTEVRRELCRVRQVGRAGAGTVSGWYYDDGDPRLGAASMLPAGCGQRIAFSVAQPVTGAEVRLECFQTILPGTGAAAQLGSFCDPSTDLVSGSTSVHCSDGIATPGYLMSNLACDAFDRTCQVDCTTDSDCTAAGLLSYVCDHRSADEVYGDARPMELPADQIHNFCVNPTCTSN
jgi:hypothetical protein